MGARKKSAAGKKPAASKGRKPRKRRAVAGARITRAEWVARAVRLAVRGWSARRIAAAVGKSHTAVQKALAEEFERVRPSEEELQTARNVHREKLLHREERLNRLIRAHWSTAVGADKLPAIAVGAADAGESIALGDLMKGAGAKYDAAKVVIDADKGLDRVHASLARLDGLDAPTKQEMTGKDGGPLVGEASPEAAAALVREIFGDRASMGSKASKAAHGPGGEDDIAERPREVPESPPSE